LTSSSLHTLDTVSFPFLDARTLLLIVVQEHIAHIAVAIDLLMKDESVALALRPRLLVQFPRWRIIGTLMKRDLEAQQAEGYDAPRLPTPGEAVPPEDPVWRQASWQCWAGIENVCFDWDLCGRRTCGKVGVILCSGCAAAKYCSGGCLTKYVTVLSVHFQHSPNFIQGQTSSLSCLHVRVSDEREAGRRG
jgi:hypothetical protein